MRGDGMANYSGEKIAAYLGTRNLYADMVTAVKSLLVHSDVDKVFFVIEDDSFPYPLPKEIEIINARNQKWFPTGGPNYKSHFSYLCVTRAAYAELFKDYTRILSIDDDTIVMDNISSLWDTDLKGNYCAGVIDLGIRRPNYFNAGVILMDLEALRKDGITQRMIDLLNREYRMFIDQDALNECCDGKILELPLRYNESPVTGQTHTPAIIHYVGTDKVGGKNAARRPFWNEYAAMSWERASELRKKIIGRGIELQN